jgi:hypothetical protein
MENNKYFTPDIEDIHVGYLCYQYNKFYNEKGELFDERWAEQLTPLFPASVRILMNEEVNIDDYIRVPYLTKEQIEDEGWVYVNIDMCWIKNGIELYLEKDNIIEILEQPNWLYKGKCKDINTFRKICKLLEI